MYLHLGQNTIVHESEILGIFDLDIPPVPQSGGAEWGSGQHQRGAAQELRGLRPTQNQEKPDGLYRPALQPDAAAPVGGGNPDRLNL